MKQVKKAVDEHSIVLHQKSRAAVLNCSFSVLLVQYTVEQEHENIWHHCWMISRYTENRYLKIYVYRKRSTSDSSSFAVKNKIIDRKMLYFACTSKNILHKAGFSDLHTRREQQLPVLTYKINIKCYQITYKVFLLTHSQSIIIARDKANIIMHCQCQCQTLML